MPRVALLSLAVFACIVAPAAAATTTRQKTFERELVRAINQYRSDHHLRPVRAQRSLGSAAVGHARSMADEGYFSHTSSDGTTFDRRIVRRYRVASARRWKVGENMLWGSTQLTPKAALQMWIDSPPHRRNLLDPTWRDIGLRAVAAEDAPGVYENLDVLIVVSDFGFRRFR